MKVSAQCATLFFFVLAFLGGLQISQMKHMRCSKGPIDESFFLLPTSMQSSLNDTTSISNSLKTVLYDPSSPISLWGAGVDARTEMIAYSNLPIITWTEEASRSIFLRWMHVQHRKACSNVLWFTPWWWGLTSQIRDYVDLAIISVLTFGRTLLHKENDRYPNKTYPVWCEEESWLMCFFEPLSGHQCNGVEPMGPGVQNEDLGILNQGYDFLQFDSLRANNLVWQHSLFPNKIWETLLADNHVLFFDSVNGSRINGQILKQENTDLYYMLSLSALRSIIIQNILVPKRAIVANVERSMQMLPPDEPAIAVHLRRTDKRKDLGTATNLTFSARHVVDCLHRIYLQTRRRYKTILILSDDPSSIVEMKQYLGPSFNVLPITNVKDFFQNIEDYQTYRKKGHTFVDTLYSKDPKAVFAYHSSVLVDSLAAASWCDFLIGVGTSGVSQLIAQLMGARRHMDGNLLSLWQEDLM